MNYRQLMNCVSDEMGAVFAAELEAVIEHMCEESRDVAIIEMTLGCQGINPKEPM